MRITLALEVDRIIYYIDRELECLDSHVLLLLSGLFTLLFH